MEHTTHISSEMKINKDSAFILSAKEVLWLVDYLGLKTGDLSPLKNTAITQHGDTERTSLTAQGLVDGIGQVEELLAKSMRTLANPGCELVVDVGNSTLFNFMKLYFGSNQSVVSFTPQDASSYKLVPELQLEDLLVIVLEGLNLDSEILENPLSFDLSQKGLLALAALVDAIRQNQLRALLNRNDNEGIMVDFLDVWACIMHGLLEDDFRWLTAVIRSRLPEEINVEQITLSEGLAEIESAGIAIRKDSTWSINEDYFKVITELMTPLNFGSISAQALLGSETIKLLLIRCPAALFAVNFGPNGKASFFTLSIDRLGLILTELMGKLILIGSEAIQPTGVDQVSASAYLNENVAINNGAGYPGQKTLNDEPVRFCGQCGQPVNAELKYCQSCGHLLSTGMDSDTPFKEVQPSVFAETIAKYEILRTRLTSGAMDLESFTEAVNTLRFQDAAGTWWQIAEDGQGWLKWDGANWVAEN